MQMKMPLLLAGCMLAATWPAVAAACPNCATSDEVWSQIQLSSPGTVCGALIAAFVVVGAAIAASTRLVPHGRMLLAGSLFLGAGLGAFVDGIVLHQILQWHSMISTPIPPVDLVTSKVNMFWDGIFHAMSWCAAAAGVGFLVRALPGSDGRTSARVVGAASIAGWGFFNLVEGLVDHQLLALHHVHPGAGELAWDLGFLAFGALQIAGGLYVAARALKSHHAA